MEVFVKQDQVAPVRVGLELFEISEYRPAAVFVLQKDAGHAARQFARHFPQVHHLSGTGGELDFEIVAQVVMKLLQRLDQQIIHREPDRPTPVGIAAEQSGGRLAGLVVDAMLHAVDRQLVRIVAMELRQRANAVGREKLVLIQHELENAAQLVSVGDGQQSPLAHASVCACRPDCW